MESLYREVDALIESRRIQGERDGNNVLIRLNRTDRIQRIHLARENHVYQFTSVVARVKHVITPSVNARNALIFRILCRNALKPVVFLSIDNRDRVVGKITCPIHSTQSNEIEFYLTALARDCDRFEYILSGSDIQ